MNEKFEKIKPFQVPPEWVPPQEVPDLREAKIIAVDVETCDPNLKTKGAGYIRKDGYVTGIALSVDGWDGYFPIKHEGGGNFDWDIISDPIKNILASDTPKVFHNALYDIGWLEALGCKVNGRIHDTMIMAPLVDENRISYTLNACGMEWIGEAKNEAMLNAMAEEFHIDPKSEMYKLPAMYVGSYAEQDTRLTLKLYERLSHIIQKEECGHILDLEERLIPITYAMKKKGVRVDMESLDALEKKLIRQENALLKKIKDFVGFDVEIHAARSLAKAFDHLNLPYDRTEKSGEPSFQKNFLTTHTHEFPRMIAHARETFKVRGTFLKGLLKHVHNGRIHADINQLKGERNNGTAGTVTGRFSYQNPNLQQIPARNKDIASMVKGLFLPEEGKKWHVFDYSQQEPRILVHYALASKGGLEGSREVLKQYDEGSDVDFHQMVADMAEISRDEAKSINLGIMYGMGKGKMSAELGLEVEDAEILLKKYHKNIPFVKELQDIAMRTASKHGHVRTLLGRKCRFDRWEPNRFGINRALPHKEAIVEYGNDLKRALTYKALNRLIQGSAADQTKKAMLDLYEEGYLADIQIHDELDISLENSQDVDRVKEIMENCVEKLKVPSVVNVRVGKTWGEAGK